MKRASESGWVSFTAMSNTSRGIGWKKTIPFGREGGASLLFRALASRQNRGDAGLADPIRSGSTSE